MQGVEILTSVRVAIVDNPNWTIGCTTLVIIFIISLVVALAASIITHEWAWIGFGIIMGVVGGSILGVVMAVIFSTNAYETQYKVTISDEVSMTEFYEHYEVIEQDGKIFTVRERENVSIQ
jgi:hypothetical protein